MHLGFHRLYGIDAKGLIRVNKGHRNNGALRLDCALKSAGQKIMYFIFVVVIAAFRENDIPPPGLYFGNHIQDRFKLLFHISLVQTGAFQQCDKLGSDDLVGTLVVDHNST